MTRRDLRWRAMGALLFVGACAAQSFDLVAAGWIIFPFAAAFVGLVLMLHGKRVAVTIRAERRGHRNTAAAIHAMRNRSRRCHADRSSE